MTSTPTHPGTDRGEQRFLIRGFPDIGPRTRNAYRELHLAAYGTKEQRRAVGNPDTLPRPWEPASCTEPRLRAEVWAWLEQVVTWLNHEYVWDIGAMIPSCWPHHPHLVHEIAVLADQCRRAGTALGSDALEEWHRYALPGFVDRMRARLRSHCEEGHQPWPARSRYTRHTSNEAEARARHRAYSHDVQAVLDHRARREQTRDPATRPRLSVVDLDTGEISDGPPH
jgi:hypothetical protein